MGANYVPPNRTVSDLARELVRLHLRTPLHMERRTSSAVCLMLREAAPSKALSESSTVETVLDHLADKGLVTRTLEEWEVSVRTPQTYRWSRLATPEALGRFVAERKVCRASGCTNATEGMFCSSTCSTRYRKTVADVCALPVATPDKRATVKRRAIG